MKHGNIHIGLQSLLIFCKFINKKQKKKKENLKIFQFFFAWFTILLYLCNINCLNVKEWKTRVWMKEKSFLFGILKKYPYHVTGLLNGFVGWHIDIFLSLRVFGLLSSLWFPQIFGWYVLRPYSGVCRTRKPSLRPLLIPLAITGYRCLVSLCCYSPAVRIEPATFRWLSP